MKKKSIFLSLIIVLLGALVLVCRQMTGVSEENASEESVVSEENASEQSAVSEENATKESKVAKKLPRDSKVFLSYTKNYKVYRKKNTFFFCYKEKVLDKVKLEEKIISNKAYTYEPYCYSSAGSLYMIQSVPKPPKLDFIKVAEGVDIVGNIDYFYVKEDDSYIKGLPVCYNEKEKIYFFIKPQSSKAYSEYAEWWVEEKGTQYDNRFLSIEFDINNILVKFDTHNDRLHWEPSCFLSYKGKKVEIEDFPSNWLEISNNFLNEIISDTDKKAYKILSGYKKYVPYQKSGQHMKNIQNFLNRWEKKNTKKIIKFYEKDPYELKSDWDLKNGVRKWCKKHPKALKKLVTTMG